MKAIYGLPFLMNTLTTPWSKIIIAIKQTNII